jgi:predicted dehydrogenase
MSERVERVRCAWLGESRDALVVARALGDLEQAELVGVAECGELAGELISLFPAARLENDWEALLTRGGFEAVLVAGDSDPVLEGARQLARGGARLLVWVGGAAPRLFSELTLLDAESPGRLHPLLPQRHLPLLSSLADDLASRKLGELLSIQFLRTQPGTTLDTATLDRNFLHDVDLLRCLLGRFEQLTAFRHADPSGRILQATTTLGGVNLPPVSWQVGPGIEAGWRLTVSGELGRMVVQANDRELTLERDGHPIESWPSPRAEAHAVRQSVADALTPPVAEGQSPGRHTTWDDLLRGVELLAATRESLRRRRTIDVLFEAPSERNLFKSHMTAAGCGLLLLTPVLVVLYLLVAAAFPLPEWLKIALVTLVFAPFGLFLLLQALVWITRPSAAEITAQDGIPMAPQARGAGPAATHR